jgi:hypothetical protein
MNFDDLYRQGRLPLSADQLAGLPISDALKGFLESHGLPVVARNDSTLGVIFTPPVAVDSEFLSIGHEVWGPEELQIALNLQTEAVVARDASTGETTFINTDLRCLLTFLSEFKAFLSRWRTHDAPTIMTQAQARERLAAMRRGELRPKPAPAKKETRSGDLAKVRNRLKALDAKAFEPDSWWGRIFEQAKDGLL